MRILALSLLSTLSCASPVFAQTSEPLGLDYRSAQDRLLQRSDAIEAAAANLRGKEAQEGATRTLGRPDVDVEGAAARISEDALSAARIAGAGGESLASAIR